MNEPSNLQIAEVLQSIFAASWTAFTASGIGRTVQLGKASERYIEPGEVVQLGLSAGYDACSHINKNSEKLAELLGVELKRPTDLELRPVFAQEADADSRSTFPA